LDPSAPQDPLWRPANPLSLLTVLLLSGEALGLGSQWSLRELDRINAGFYIPYDYLSFAEEPMSEGMNYVRRVGFDFWTAKQFAVHFGELTAKKLTSAAQSLSHEAILSMCLSSLIFPNRLPLCLEAVMPRVR
jgi:hypothetical protein